MKLKRKKVCKQPRLAETIWSVLSYKIFNIQQYVEGDPSGRDIDSTALIQIKQGFEPVNFTCYFHAWNPNMWKQDSSYDAYLAKIKSEGQTEATSVQEVW